MKTRKIDITVLFVVVLSILFGSSCSDFLDIVPDNTATIDHAFKERYYAEASLYGLYSFLPVVAHPSQNPAFLAGEESWMVNNFRYFSDDMWRIAKGEQGTNSPIGNYWASESSSYVDELKGGTPIFTGISDCNIFTESIHATIDITEEERNQWIAEAKVLKAYFHFWLLNMYGPVPIIKENVEVNASSQESQLYREPVDSVFNYIVELIDEASDALPLQVSNITNELGRITRPVALALKAKVLIYAASPLFNGNPQYADFQDSRGIKLFSQAYDAGKWEKAADALKEAIDVCHEAGHQLFDFSTLTESQTLNEKTVLAMQVRGAATERWNTEIIWGDTQSSTSPLQRFGLPWFIGYNSNSAGYAYNTWAPTLKVVKQFYTNNGVPVEEDKDWAGVDLYGLRTAVTAENYTHEPGYTTINLHFNREARFYGSIHFDGGRFYGNGTTPDNSLLTCKTRYMSYGISFYPDRYPSTGYLVKKMTHRLTNLNQIGAGVTIYRYAFPAIRLADLYLLYAEALNEVKGIPDTEVYEYIDLVRNRTGLEGVIESWTNYSTVPDKPLTKEGMRDIIRRERLIELAFEGHRYWDLRRWKLLKAYMNEPVQGFNFMESEPQLFYQVQTVYTPHFEDKDYLWPIRQGNLLNNSHLVQNPGW
ncbi:MAG: RagB/SusD family nutrient uptake outer membrane protein [Mangrovibacterium sp.]